MFLIDAIKSNKENRLAFLCDCLGEEQNKTIFASFCVRIVSCNKNIIQKKREKPVSP